MIREFEKQVQPPGDPDRRKTSNCYRCGKEELLDKLIKLENRRKVNGWIRGDVLIVCKECHNGSGG